MPFKKAAHQDWCRLPVRSDQTTGNFKDPCVHGVVEMLGAQAVAVLQRAIAMDENCSEQPLLGFNVVGRRLGRRIAEGLRVDVHGAPRSNRGKMFCKRSPMAHIFAQRRTRVAKQMTWLHKGLV